MLKDFPTTTFPPPIKIKIPSLNLVCRGGDVDTGLIDVIYRTCISDGDTPPYGTLNPY